MSFRAQRGITVPAPVPAGQWPSQPDVILNEVKNLVQYRDVAHAGHQAGRIMKDEILHFVQNDIG